MNLFQVTKKQPSGGLELKTATGDIASFATHYSEPLPAPFNNLNVKCAITASGGGGTPSTPIPIVGYSEVNLTRCGVNFTDISDNTIAGAGYVIGPAPQYINGEHFYLPSGKYTFSFDITNATYPNACQIIVYGHGIEVTRETKSGISQSGKITITFTANAEINQMLLYCNSSTGGSFSNFQMEVGSTAHSYEPYNGQTITISLGQTVYGGRLYFENGWKCEVTHGYVDLATCIWGGGSDVGGRNLFTVAIPDIKRPDTTSTLPNWKIEGYELKTQVEAVNYNNVYSGLGWFDGVAFWTTDYTASQREQLKADMSGIHLVYELATPFTLDLSSSDMLDAVVGINNVFADTGSVEVKYLDVV